MWQKTNVCEGSFTKLKTGSWKRLENRHIVIQNKTKRAPAVTKKNMRQLLLQSHSVAIPNNPDRKQPREEGLLDVQFRLQSTMWGRQGRGIKPRTSSQEQRKQMLGSLLACFLLAFPSHTDCLHSLLLLCLGNVSAYDGLSLPSSRLHLKSSKNVVPDQGQLQQGFS